MGGNREGLAVRRSAVGFTQERLAEYIGVNIKTVSRWENGESSPYARHRPLLADALQVTMEELLALLDGSPCSQPTGGGLSPIRIAPVVERRHWLSAPAASPGFADTLLASLDQYSRADNLNGPLPLLPLLVQQTRFAMSLIRDAGPREQPALTLAGARLAEFTGWLYQDAGGLNQAMQWTNTALDLATEAGEVDLIAYLWMRKANVASDARRPQLIRQFAEAGLKDGRKLTPRMRAVILRVEAHAHAITGDYDACARTIDAALAEVTDSTSASSDLADYCTAGYIQMEAAHCWTELGRPEAAIEHLAAEVEVWDPTFRRDLGLCLARLGVAEAKAGDLEAAAASGRRSLAIAGETRSRRTIDQLHVLAELLDKPASADEAAQLRSALVDLDHHELPALEGPPEWI